MNPIPDDHAAYLDAMPDPFAAFGDVVPFKVAPARKPLPFVWVQDVQPVLDGFWLIDDWLPKSGVGAIYGHPGSGKTFVALDMAASIAGGHDWAGRSVEKGLVVYVVAEGVNGFRNRLFAMTDAGRLQRGAPFMFVPVPVDLFAPDGDAERLCDAITDAVDTSCTNPALIVIDTLSKTIGAGKENTDDVAIYIANCERIAQRFETFVLFVHHRPKDRDSTDMRGHSSLRGNIDAAIMVESHGDRRTATTTKQKDGEDNQRIAFELERVVLGHDAKGKEVSTCLVNITDDAPPTKANLSPLEKAKAKLKGHNRTGLRVIETTVATEGVVVAPDIPANVIDREKVHYVCRSGQVADKLESEFLAIVDGDPDKRADNSSRTVRRVLTALKAAQILGSWQDWVWINQ